MATRPIRVWSGTAWEDVAIAPFDSGEFLSAATASATYAPTSSPTFTGFVKTSGAIEKATVISSPPGSTINFDASASNSIIYYTASAGSNWTLNVRGSSSQSLNSILSNGESFSLALLVTNGVSSSYYQTALQVDGLSVTPKWQSASISGGSANAIDLYSLTLIKTGSATYTALESQTKFV